MTNSTPIDPVARVTSLRQPSIAGLAVIAILLGGFTAWAFSAPLSGAVIVSGQVVTDNSIQIVKHERGGVLSALDIREGAHVKSGDIIATLNRTEDQAALDELKSRTAALAARLLRLSAERAGRTDFILERSNLPQVVGDLDREVLDDLVADQNSEFRDRTTQQANALAILSAQKRAVEEQLAGAEGEIASLDGQLESLATDAGLRREAIKQGFGRQSALREMERQIEAAEGARAKAIAGIAALRHQIDEADKRRQSQQSEFMQKVSDELSRTRSEFNETLKALAGKREAVARVDIRAPLSGVVKKIHVSTLGSAVEPFRPLFEIVPEGQPLLIEAHVAPGDIDNVYANQPARVVLSAFNRHLTDPAQAIVEFVAADATRDEATGQSYYIVRLAVSEQSRKILPAIVPGMPAEAYIVTGERTFADYIAEPFVQSFQRAFRQ